jgi:hypothetical protein
MYTLLAAHTRTSKNVSHAPAQATNSSLVAQRRDVGNDKAVQGVRELQTTGGSEWRMLRQHRVAVTARASGGTVHPYSTRDQTDPAKMVDLSTRFVAARTIHVPP